jgi:hypothetical protein
MVGNSKQRHVHNGSEERHLNSYPFYSKGEKMTPHLIEIEFLDEKATIISKSYVPYSPTNFIRLPNEAVQIILKIYELVTE